MAIPTLYLSTDSGAPVVDQATAGSFLAVLRACLVDGYGSKSPAGWTEPYTGTNIAAFRNDVASGGTGAYVRVDDTVTTANNWRPVTIDVYRTMSDLNTGTDKLTSQFTSRRPNNTNTPSTVSWAVVATPTACWATMWQGAVANVYSTLVGFGDVNSLVASDAWRYFCSGSNNSSSGPSWLNGSGGAGVSNPTGPFLGADHLGTTKNVSYGLWPTFGPAAVGWTSYPVRPSVTGADEAVLPAYLARGSVLRARLPGVYVPVANLSGLTYGTIVDDLVASGSRLIYMPHSGSGLWVETALDWG